MTGWQETTLGKLCEESGGDIQTGPFGSQLHASDYVSVGIPSIMPQNIGDNRISTDGIARIKEEDAKRLARYLVRDGDIVYSRRGDVERRALIRDRENGWLCGTGCLRVRFGNKKKVSPTFMSYYLGAPDIRSWIVQHAVGATMPNLNTGILSNVPVLLPDYPNQKAIAAILGTLDDKIELNRRMNSTLEAMARALFKSWFVDFDPVRAKMEGRPPFGMDAATAALFPARFSPSAHGDIPKGWEIVKFSALFETIGGGTPKTSNPEYWGGDIPWFSVVDAPSEGDVFVIDTEKTITQKGVDESSTRILPEGTTIISARGTVGRLALVGRPMAMNQSCYGLSPANGVTPSFLYFSARKVVSELQARAHGSVFDTITRDTLDSISVIKTDNACIQAYETAAGSFLEKIKGNLIEANKLQRIRDYLLPKLISGELRIRDAEKFIEDAA